MYQGNANLSPTFPKNVTSTVSGFKKIRWKCSSYDMQDVLSTVLIIMVMFYRLRVDSPDLVIANTVPLVSNVIFLKFYSGEVYGESSIDRCSTAVQVE
jgi:hypothetical protein